MGAFEGKVAVSTGGAHGIGRAITDAFLREGAVVHTDNKIPGSVRVRKNAVIDLTVFQSLDRIRDHFINRNRILFVRGEMDLRAAEGFIDALCDRVDVRRSDIVFFFDLVKDRLQRGFGLLVQFLDALSVFFLIRSDHTYISDGRLLRFLIGHFRAHIGCHRIKHFRPDGVQLQGADDVLFGDPELRKDFLVIVVHKGLRDFIDLRVLFFCQGNTVLFRVLTHDHIVPDRFRCAHDHLLSDRLSVFISRVRVEISAGSEERSVVRIDHGCFIV